MLGSEKEFDISEAQTHGPGCSVPMFKVEFEDNSAIQAPQHLRSVEMLCALKNPNVVKVINWARLPRDQYSISLICSALILNIGAKFLTEDDDDEEEDEEDLDLDRALALGPNNYNPVHLQSEGSSKSRSANLRVCNPDIENLRPGQIIRDKYYKAFSPELKVQSSRIDLRPLKSLIYKCAPNIRNGLVQVC